MASHRGSAQRLVGYPFQDRAWGPVPSNAEIWQSFRQISAGLAFLPVKRGQPRLGRDHVFVTRVNFSLRVRSLLTFLFMQHLSPASYPFIHFLSTFTTLHWQISHHPVFSMCFSSFQTSRFHPLTRPTSMSGYPNDHIKICVLE